MFSRIKRYFKQKLLSPEPSFPPAHTKSSPEKLDTQASQDQEPLRFLSLPIEIRIQIYALLLCSSGKIELLYKRDCFNGPRLRFMEQGPWQQWIDPNILLSNKKIHAEASDVLYSQAILHLHCDGSLRCPFPELPLRGFGKSIRYPNKEGDKLSSEVFRRFKKIKLTVFVASLHDSELPFRDIDYHGSSYGYTPNEMRAGLRGLKDVLGALAVSGKQRDAYGVLNNESRNLKFLYLSLKWPSNMKKCTADDFEEHWKEEGVWDLLSQVAKIRTIEFGGSAQRDFGRQWL